MKKFKLKKNHKPNKVYDSELILKLIIDSELRPYGKVLEDINTEENGKINEEPWYIYYKFKTKAQEDVWNEYCNKLIRKHYYPYYISKSEADRMLMFPRLNYALAAGYKYED